MAQIGKHQLYASPSPWSQKAIFTLDYIGLPYEFKMYSKKQHKSLIQQKMNFPSHQHVTIPFLIKPDGLGIMDSWEIAEYVANLYPQKKPTFMPDHLKSQIKTLDQKIDIIRNYTRREMFIYIVSNPGQIGKNIGLDPTEVKQWFTEQLNDYGQLPGAGDKGKAIKVVQEVTKQLKDNGGEFIVGKQFTFADISLSAAYALVNSKIPTFLPNDELVKIYDQEFIRESQSLLKYRENIYDRYGNKEQRSKM